MAKSLKKRVRRLEVLVESLAQKIEALGKTAVKKAPRRRAKASKTAAASKARKAKRAVVKPVVAFKPATPTALAEDAPQSVGA